MTNSLYDTFTNPHVIILSGKFCTIIRRVKRKFVQEFERGMVSLNLEERESLRTVFTHELEHVELADCSVEL